ncbi:hypothetical protein SDC9_209323 [bioreactor metagenome]|uniref:Uncharacterized protein n=1 Tax=bioreactor metagenome TaxID=1076179 RepID=A0A645JCY5_9ZZZZ
MWIDDLVDGRFSKLYAHEQDHDGHDKPRDVFDASMAEWVRGIRWLVGHLEAHEGDD